MRRKVWWQHRVNPYEVAPRIVRQARQPRWAFCWRVRSLCEFVVTSTFFGVL